MSKSVSIGLGLFFGIAPFWGFQMIIVFSICKYFKLNTALSLIASNISLPPLIPFIIYFSYKLGAYFVLDNHIQIDISKPITLEMIHYNFIQYFLGALALAFITSLIGFAATLFTLKLFKLK